MAKCFGDRTCFLPSAYLSVFEWNYLKMKSSKLSCFSEPRSSSILAMAILMTILIFFPCTVIWCFIIWSWTISQILQHIFLTEQRIIRHIFAVSPKHYHAYMPSYNHSTYGKSSVKCRNSENGMYRQHIKIISRNILSGVIYYWINYMHVTWSRIHVFNSASTHYKTCKNRMAKWAENNVNCSKEKRVVWHTQCSFASFSTLQIYLFFIIHILPILDGFCFLLLCAVKRIFGGGLWLSGQQKRLNTLYFFSSHSSFLPDSLCNSDFWSLCNLRKPSTEMKEP